jgi:hypothetical protein
MIATVRNCHERETRNKYVERKQKDHGAVLLSHTFHSLSAALLALFLGLATAPRGNTLLV